MLVGWAQSTFITHDQLRLTNQITFNKLTTSPTPIVCIFLGSIADIAMVQELVTYSVNGITRTS
jgi:hypothetical protein